MALPRPPMDAPRYRASRWPLLLYLVVAVIATCFLFSRYYAAIALPPDASVDLSLLMKLFTSLSASSFTLCGAAVSAYNVYDLGHSSWTVSDPGNNVSVPGRVPSHVLLDLYAAGVIPDPYYGLNDFDLRWVTYSNWTYATTLPKSYAARGYGQPGSSWYGGHQGSGGYPGHGGEGYGHGHGYGHGKQSTWLVFNGLDTFTSISLCGEHVAATNNQFRQYYFDVSDILSSCKDDAELAIDFGSAVNISAAIAAQPDQETWPFSVQNTFEFANRWFIRKEQSDFGWDWGPAFAPAGPWLPAYVVTLQNTDAYIRNTLVDVYRQGQLPLLLPDQSAPWVVNVSLDYLGQLPKEANLVYTLRDSKGKTTASGKLTNITTSDGIIGGSTIIPDGEVDLWWPTGMGPQNLYNLTVEIVGTSNKASVTKRVGFRTIVLNEFPISEEQLAQGIAPGNNWHFEVNGHTFYAKGSNFIPPDVFWPRVTPGRIEKLFDAVILGNQNMLRVWSSGVYSPDFMYDLADEMGILLWSEFEFGDALYPVDDEFIENVKEEVTYQVRRVNHHPSLAYWAGGNELENLELTRVRTQAPEQYDYYLHQYEYLFLDTIVPILFGNSRSISYSPSSTSNGWLSLDFDRAQPITERYYNTTDGSIYGETDYYNYNSGVAFTLSSYPVGRFSNEFGYHSMPSLQSWEQAVDPADLYFDSPVVTLRNHHYPAGGPFTDNFANATKGMAEMTLAVQRWYPTPTKSDPIANFSSWNHATQIFQADFYKSQIEFYRRGSGRPERQLGCLYWQLEDIWQAPTWAGIEYDGRWKVLHSIARDIYEPVVVASYFNDTSGALDVYVTSDLWASASGTVSLSWLDWEGNVLGSVGASSSTRVFATAGSMDDAPTTGVGGAPSSVDFTVGAINSTRVWGTAGALNDTLAAGGHKPEDVVLRLEVSAKGSAPNTGGEERDFSHVNWFHAAPLSQAKLVDPGLRFSWAEDGSALTVEATEGVSAWTWIDYPKGAVVAFAANGFWLGKGEKKTVKVEKVWEDSTGGKWKDGVTVTSLWDLNHE